MHPNHASESREHLLCKCESKGCLCVFFKKRFSNARGNSCVRLCLFACPPVSCKWATCKRCVARCRNYHNHVKCRHAPQVCGKRTRVTKLGIYADTLSSPQQSPSWLSVVASRELLVERRGCMSFHLCLPPQSLSWPQPSGILVLVPARHVGSLAPLSTGHLRMYGPQGTCMRPQLGRGSLGGTRFVKTTWGEVMVVESRTQHMQHKLSRLVRHTQVFLSRDASTRR